jgi:hypothetical protein
VFFPNNCLVAFAASEPAPNAHAADDASVFRRPGFGLRCEWAIAMSNFGALVSRPAPGQSPGPPIAVGNGISVTGTDYFGSYGKRGIDFNGIVSGTGLVAVIGDHQNGTVVLNGNNTYSGGTAINSPNLTVTARRTRQTKLLCGSLQQAAPC